MQCVQAVPLGNARIRVIHNVAGGPPVDVYIDNRQLLRNFTYRTVSNYIEIRTGQDRLVRLTPNRSNTIIDEALLTVQPNAAYTLIIHGLATRPQTIKVMLLLDNLECPRSGYSRVRFVHAAADYGPVDVLVRDTVAFHHVGYGEMGTPGYYEVPAGKIPITLTPDHNPRDILETVDLNLQGGEVYTLILSGNNTRNYPLLVLASEDSQGSCVVGHY